MSPVPLLFLGVDGTVVTGQPSPLRTPDAARKHMRNAAPAGPVWFRPGVVERLNSMVDDELVEPIWLTARGDAAPAVLAPAIGLHGQDWPAPRMPLNAGLLPSAPTRHPIARHLWWKTQAVLSRTRDGRAFLWVDDEIDTSARNTLRALRQQPSLVLVPRTGTGMTMEHLAAIERFVAVRAQVAA